MYMYIVYTHRYDYECICTQYVPTSSKVMKYSGVTASHSQCQAEGATSHQTGIGRHEMNEMGVKTFEY